MKLGNLGVWYFFDRYTASAAAAHTKHIEALGYDTLWIPEAVGRDSMVSASWLLAHTQRLKVATGIASIYLREPGAMVAAQNTLAEQSGNRFLLGLGVSHKSIVEGVRGLEYTSPVSTMSGYLDAMASSPYQSMPPSEKPPTVIAALGPKMLGLARDKCAGAHPYFVSPDHTAMAREILGPDKWLCVEQKVVLETDTTTARAAARDITRIALPLCNYRNSWLRMGLTEADLENGGSDAFIDATFAWGDADTIKARIQEHFDAGADHVCIQPVHPNRQLGDLHWEALEALAPH